MEKKKQTGLGARISLLIWTLGLAGQIGWSIEGQWFNNFVYEKIDKDPTIITAMLIASAAATTIATFIFGTIADRTGKRRTLINIGYIAMGIITIAFGYTEFLGKEFYLLACISVVLGDMLVSLFGAMGIESGFNTWTTDIMTDSNRGQVSGIVAIQTVLSTVLCGVFGSLLIGKDNNYIRLFTVVGCVLIIFGVLSGFFMGKKDDVEPSVRGTFTKQLTDIFNFKQFSASRELLLIYIATTIYFAGFDSYFMYLGNYLIHYLEYSANMIGIIEAIPLILSMLIAVPIANLINKKLHFLVTVIAILSAICGMFFMAAIQPDEINPENLIDIRVFMGILLLGVGYVVMLQAMKAWTKELYPENSKGQFEGMWIVFFSLFPMLLGSLISQLTIKKIGYVVVKYFFGPTEYIPNENLFIVGVLVSCLSIIPICFAYRHLLARNAEKKESKPNKKKKSR